MSALRFVLVPLRAAGYVVLALVAAVPVFLFLTVLLPAYQLGRVLCGSDEEDA